MGELGDMLLEISGLDGITMSPSAGAHGEFAGMLMIRAYHQKNGNSRKKVLIPDTAHGTNPASVVMAGYKSVKIPSDSTGQIDLAGLDKNLDQDVAAIMITNPNTLGVFEERVKQIADKIDTAGALMYMDGANLNAMMGITRPGDMGFDVVHLNLHKTFSTPHGGGGPGAGPVAVRRELVPYLPVPVVDKNKDGYYLNWDRPDSIGRMISYWGNFLVLVRAYAYLLRLGDTGIRRVSEVAVLNSKYLRKKIAYKYDLFFDVPHLHEFVMSG
jgi:glycine dehydrogenase subunit 2